MAYIPKEKAYTLKQFKYTGGTDSITYEHIWSPMAESLLKLFPMWMAPNLITFIGLSQLVVTHIIFMLPDQNDVIPFWKFLMVALSILAYQQLDNIDGKQARRTGSSSPLGMLFDHGTDTLIAFTIGLQAMKVLRLGYEFQIAMIPIFLMSQYFCCMWSQYCVGYFRLGRINPVDEGLPFYAMMFLMGSQVSGENFRSQHILGTYGEQFMFLLMVPLIPVLITMSKDVFTKSKKSMYEALFMTLLVFSTAGALYATLWSIEQLNSTVFYPFYYATMFMWCRNMILIQLQFITSQKYKVFNRGTLSYIILCLIYIVFSKTLPVMHEHYFLFMCISQGVIFFEFIVTVLNEGARILGIRVFSLKKPAKID